MRPLPNPRNPHLQSAPWISQIPWACHIYLILYHMKPYDVCNCGGIWFLPKLGVFQCSILMYFDGWPKMCCCTTAAGMNGEVNSDLTSPAIPVKGWTATNISWFVSRAATFEDLNSGVWCLPWWTWSLGQNKFNTSGAQSRDLMKVGQQVATWSKRYASQLVCG